MFIYSNTMEKVLTTYGSAIIFFCLHFWTVPECLKRESKTLTNKQRVEVRNYMNSENNTSWGWGDGWVSYVPAALALDRLGLRTQVRWLTHTYNSSSWRSNTFTPSSGLCRYCSMYTIPHPDTHRDTQSKDKIFWKVTK